MKIISISGIDGSGKSTQLKMLKKYLTERNKKVESFHSVSFSLINNFLKKKKEASIEKIKEETNEHPDQAIMFDQPAKAVTSGNFLTILARKIILIIDLFRFKLFTKKLRREKTNYLLTDRYFYDQIINILYLDYKKKIIKEISNPRGKKLNIKLCPLLKLANYLTPKPTISFFIDVSPKIALSRDRDIEQGKEYLVIKRVMYKKLTKKFNMQIINGNQDKETIHKIILEFIK